MSRFLAYSLILVGLAATVVAVGYDHPRFVRGEPAVEPATDQPDTLLAHQWRVRQLPPNVEDGPTFIDKQTVTVED